MFCLKYFLGDSYIQDELITELSITYNPKDTTLEDFIKKYQNKQIIINIDNTIQDVDVTILQSLSNKYRNIKLSLLYSNREILHKFNNVPFFFSNPVTTIDQMCGFITYHPTDMYICEELGFFLDNVSNLLHSNNIKIRIYPNVCQSSFPETNSLKTFFVRPDDIRTYKKYVDVFEIFVSPIDERQAQRTRQQIIFKAYKNEEWYGEISEIIPSFNGKLDSRYVISSFGTIRPHCHKRCVYNPNVCKVCDNCAGVADALKKHLLTVKRLQKMKSIQIPQAAEE